MADALYCWTNNKRSDSCPNCSINGDSILQLHQAFKTSSLSDISVCLSMKVNVLRCIKLSNHFFCVNEPLLHCIALKVLEWNTIKNKLLNRCPCMYVDEGECTLPCIQLLNCLSVSRKLNKPYCTDSPDSWYTTRYCTKSHRAFKLVCQWKRMTAKKQFWPPLFGLRKL